MTFSTQQMTSQSLRRLVTLAFVAMTFFTSSAEAWAAPTIPNAPYGLYMPSVSNDVTRLETLEVSVVHLNQNQAQAQSPTKAASSPQAGEDGLLPAPPPGEELHPAQADAANPTPIVEGATATTPDSVTLLQEDFDGAFPTGNWRAFDKDGGSNGEYYWDDDDARSLNGNNSAWVANGGQNGLDPDYYDYPNNLQSWMVYGPIDLSDAGSAALTFSYWNLSEIHYDYLGWYASPNGVDFYGLRASGNSTGWKAVTLDLSKVPVTGNLLGDSSVWIAFLFTSDGNTSARGAFIDQLRLQKETNNSSGCAGGFKADYFNNKELSGNPQFSRCEKAPINQQWGLSAPGNGIGVDNFSVRWSGSFDFDAGAYNFVAITDDGVRVWLDDKQILNNWQNQSLTPNLATRQLSAGRHSLRVEYYEDVGGATAQLRWLRSDTTVSNRQAFDTCLLPQPSEMQAWWGNSPYYEVGVYIGGSNRGCKAQNQNLTGSWVASVQQQGWNIIPTWVGPQAPCTAHNFYTMSSNPQNAFAEGQREAGDAAVAARNLGLTTDEWGGAVIYYDMEPYPNEAGCRDAVKSFMAGWASRLHELGNQAGGYGAACASYMSDWVQEAPYTLDQIWPAAWISPGYNPNTSVWDVSCIDNSIWTNHQRIRQYAGDHNERWANLTFTIDSNIADGRVAGTIPRAQAAGAPQAQERWHPLQLGGMQLLAKETGWVLAEGQLLWTNDSGATWLNRTPNDLPLEAVAASFLDANHGWLVAATSSDMSTFYLGKTEDGGLTWQLHPLPEVNPSQLSPAQGAIQLDFVDANSGYLQIKLPSSSNFDLHTRYKSVDGGATWHETSEGLPALTASSASPELAASAAALGATASLGNGTAWAYVQHGLCSGIKPAADATTVAEQPFDCIQTSALLTTPDGGQTWIDITPIVK